MSKCDSWYRMNDITFKTEHVLNAPRFNEIFSVRMYCTGTQAMIGNKRARPGLRATAN